MSDTFYGKWLANVMDVDGKYRSVLSMLSGFDQLDYASIDDHYQYAQAWCNLAQFLWDNRQKQLYSTRVQPMFHIDAETTINIYWFEVLNACNGLLRSLFELLTRDMHLLEVSHTKLYTCVLQDHDGGINWLRLLTHIKQAIGICHFTIHIAAVRCIYIQTHAEALLADITQKYHTLRIIGAWIQANRMMEMKQFEGAERLFATVEALAQQRESASIAASCLQSTSYLKAACTIQRLAHQLKPGLAVGYGRHMVNFKHRADQLRLSQLLDSIQCGPEDVVPPKRSPLIQALPIKDIDLDVLKKGSDPLKDFEPFELKLSLRSEPAVDQTNQTITKHE